MREQIATDFHTKRRIRCRCGCNTLIKEGDRLMRASKSHRRYYLEDHYFSEPRNPKTFTYNGKRLTFKLTPVMPFKLTPVDIVGE